MSTPPIIIAGAGLAGLTLGRCLLSKGIGTLVIEKAAPSPRRHNYSMDLSSWAYKPLLGVLGMDEAAFRERLSVNPLGSRRDDPTISPLERTSLDCFRAHRGRLESLLGEGLDIRWERAVTGVSLSSPKIVVKIENEPPIVTALLVGADGAHSAVCHSQGLDMTPLVHDYVVFYGTRRILKEQYTRLFAPQMQDSVEIKALYHDVLLRIFINNTTSTHVDLGYTYSRPRDHSKYPEHKSDHLHRPDRPIAGANDVPKEFYAELDALKNLSSAYTEIFDSAKAQQDRVLHWLMRSILPSCENVHALTRSGVVMIGDAVHAMPIVGSEGGNIAIKDGFELAEWIATNGMNNFEDFMNERYQDWRDGIERGVQRLEQIHTERGSL